MGCCMEYLALYRKYRPSSFKDMVGQEEVKDILSSSVMNNTISHAYLFSGPRGTGKTSTAKIFAKLVNCKNPIDGAPCNKCECCKSFSDSSDIIEIDAASNNGVDEIRDLREKANLVPSISKYKVYIIDEVHMLTTQAFNALLKTLEEPPRHVIFILATTEYHKVPLTISSRCQKFQFNKLSIEDNFKKLKEISEKEDISITDDALYEIAKISDGGMRDSINYLDQIRSFKSGKIDIADVNDVCGNVSFDEISNLLINIRNNNAIEISSYLEEIGNNGKSYNKFLEDILLFLKEVILLKNDISYNNIKLDVNLLKKVSDNFSVDEIFMITDKIDKLIEKLKYSSRQSILVVTNFLLIMNLINKNSSVDKKDNFDNYDSVNAFVKKDESRDVNIDNANLQLNVEKDTGLEVYSNDNFYFNNREIIINNAFSTASKTQKNSLQSKFDKINDYLLDKKYNSIVSLLVDCKIAVTGDSYVVFNTTYDSVIDNIYSKSDLVFDFLSNVFGKEMYFAFISDDEWNKYKNEYIDSVKNNIVYEIKEFIANENEEKNIDLHDDKNYVNKLIDIVGDDVVEFK